MLGTKCPKCGGKNWVVKTNFGYRGAMTETYTCMTCERIPWRLPPERLSDYPGRVYQQAAKSATQIPQVASSACQLQVMAAIAPIRTDPPKVALLQLEPPTTTCCKADHCTIQLSAFDSLEFFPFCSYACKTWQEDWTYFLSASKSS